MRYRQLGYGITSDLWQSDDPWRAVWLDVESISTGNLLTVIFPTGKEESVMPFNDTIYRTLKDTLSAIALGIYNGN